MTKCKKCKCEGMKAKANQKVVKPVEHPKFTGIEGLMFHHNWVRLARLNDEIREKLNSMIAERDRLNADIQFFTRIDHYLNHELNSMKNLDSRQVKDNSPELEKQSELYNV